jgi:hypothetical protein
MILLLVVAFFFVLSRAHTAFCHDFVPDVVVVVAVE